MVDYMAAIKKPFGNLQAAGIGTIVGLIPLVNLLLNGYGLQTAKKTLNKDNSLPGWTNNIGDLIVKTIMAIIIGIIYSIPATVVIVIGAMAAITPILGAISSGSADALMPAIMGALAVGGIFFLIGALLALLGAVLTIMGLMNYLKEGKFGAAFAIGKLFKKVFTVAFILAFIVSIVYSLVVLVVAVFISGVLNIIPVLGFFIGLLVMGLASYMLTVTTMTIYAQVYNETP
ncbi:MAG: DUF4013 domain-containing protein [Candidatus Diapherotrites archaeon]